MVFAKIISRSYVYAVLFFLLMVFQTSVSVLAETTETSSPQWDKSRQVGRDQGDGSRGRSSDYKLLKSFEWHINL